MSIPKSPRTPTSASLRIRMVLGGLFVACLWSAVGAAPPKAGAGNEDPFVWLEDLSGDRAMTWVKAENAKTLGVLEKDTRYDTFYAEALRIAESKDRLPMPRFLAGDIYNLWQDTDHVRGIWRKTSLAEYRKPSPAWQTVIDVDALATAEKANWVWKGADCERPAERLCLISLSDGGEDATTVREFSLATGKFVAGGFELPHGKQDTAWLDSDELLVAREWGPGTMTSSGYPFVVKSLKRGQPLADAKELFRGTPDDVGVNLYALEDGRGHRATLILRHTTFFETEFYLVRSTGPAQLNLPLKARVQELVDGQLLVSLEQDWTNGDSRFTQGSLLSIDLDAAYSDPGQLTATAVFVPGPRESLGDVGAMQSRVLVTVYDNVRGRTYVYTRTGPASWTRTSLDLPDNASIDVVAADSNSDRGIVGVTSFLAPTTLWLVDSTSGALDKIKELPAQFDASKDVVEQHEATSKDGTKVPYFIVHPRDLKPAGQNPTILYAYGGFQVSETPSYSGTNGKLWLERGGTFVLANIRGGGEFGPAWHEAGLKTNRQRIYDDFRAVADDLIARKITSPRRLGIEGGSNGGLLMGVELTQHPELWNAVDIAVPLLDMLRFEKIAAGASWVAEYGSVANPKERAFLASISPYNNLRKGVHYPVPLVWTTTKDDRVGPQHARKFAARLAALGDPYFFYEVIEGGHAAGANLKEKAHTNALVLTYFTRQLMD